jgi:Domain of unknown function (DUF4382)
MRLNGTYPGAAKAFKAGLFALLLFFAILLFCASLSGCDNSCVTVTVNPGGGIISGTDSTCTVPKMTGNVRLSLNSSVAGDAATESPSTQHIFVSLRGVEALRAPAAGENSSDWEELAPALATRPIQVDLLARAAESCGTNAFGDAAIPQGVYKQVRLRFVPDQLKTNEPVPAENACGATGFNCVVAGEDTLRSIVWGETAELRIPAERIEGGFFRVLPGGDVRLAVEFDPRSSMAAPAGDAVRLFPTFSVSQQEPCESAQR